MKLRAWVLAARPKTLLAILAPVMLGSAIAWHDGAFDVVRSLVAFLAGLWVQVGTNFFNDYADFKLGADTDDRKGPTRAVVSGLISPSQMLVGTFVAFGLAMLCAVWLVQWAGWGMLALGAVSVVCGFWYTAGRWSLAYLGLGEVFVILFFGFVATGATYYIQADALPWYVLASGLVPGMLSTCLIIVNNWRDIEEDRLAGKRTLAVRFGAGFAYWEYMVCLVVGVACPAVVLTFAGFRSWPALGLWLLLLVPFGLVFGKGLRPALRGRALLPFLGMTAVLLLVVSLLFSMAWVLV